MIEAKIQLPIIAATVCTDNYGILARRRDRLGWYALHSPASMHLSHLRRVEFPNGLLGANYTVEELEEAIEPLRRMYYGMKEFALGVYVVVKEDEYLKINLVYPHNDLGVWESTHLRPRSSRRTSSEQDRLAGPTSKFLTRQPVPMTVNQVMRLTPRRKQFS